MTKGFDVLARTVLLSMRAQLSMTKDVDVLARTVRLSMRARPSLTKNCQLVRPNGAPVQACLVVDGQKS